MELVDLTNQPSPIRDQAAKLLHESFDNLLGGDSQ